MMTLHRYSSVTTCALQLTLYVVASSALLSEQVQIDLLSGTRDLELNNIKPLPLPTGNGLVKPVGGVTKVFGRKSVKNRLVPVIENAERIVPELTISRSNLKLESAVTRAKQELDAAAKIDQDMFNQNIDTSNSQTPGFGPQLLTNPKAIQVSDVSELLLQTVKDTVENAKSSGSRIVPLARAKTIVGDKKATTTKQFISKITPILKDNFRMRLCPFEITPNCDASSRYRTADGTCNNKINKLWGKSFTPFERFIHPLYDDDIGEPRSLDVNLQPLPGPREISVQYHKPSGNSDRMKDLSHFFMEFGQFVSHDIQFNALSKGRYGQVNLQCCNAPNRKNCLPIKIPVNDPYFGQPHIKRTCMNFVRSLASTTLECTGPRQQINQNTHYLDGSAIYGSDAASMSSLRTRNNGLLKTSNGDLLPQDLSNQASCRLPNNNNKIKCFQAGDVRVNQQPALVSIQTIWMREHNRIAKLLKGVNTQWDDEKLFQEARRLVIAKLQHITYKEYLPKILGNVVMNRFDLNPEFSGYFTKYNQKVKPMIRNSFMTAAYRFGHSTIDTKLAYHPSGSPNFNSNFRDVFLRPDWIYRTDGGVSSVMRGLYETNSQKIDRLMTYEVTRHLFQSQHGNGIDLAAINIQRGRDHGIAGYNVWREICGLQPAEIFSPSLGNGLIDHSEDDAATLESLYPSVDDIDLFSGGVSEIPLPGAKVGPTFACLIGLQFKALKYGDRYYYESNTDVKFNPSLLDSIRKTTMSKIICDNTDINEIFPDVFMKGGTGNQKKRCLSLPKSECIPRHGGWTKWKSAGGGCMRRRSCTNPRPNECGDQCFGRKIQYNCSFPDIFIPGPFPAPRPVPFPRPGPRFPSRVPDLLTI